MSKLNALTFFLEETIFQHTPFLVSLYYYLPETRLKICQKVSISVGCTIRHRQDQKMGSLTSTAAAHLEYQGFSTIESRWLRLWKIIERIWQTVFSLHLSFFSLWMFILIISMQVTCTKENKGQQIVEYLAVMITKIIKLWKKRYIENTTLSN